MRMRRGLTALTVTAGIAVTLSGCLTPSAPPETLAPEATPTATVTAAEFARQACTTFDGWGDATDPATLDRAVKAAESAAAADGKYGPLRDDLRDGARDFNAGIDGLRESLTPPSTDAAPKPDARVEAAANLLAQGAKTLDRAVGACTDLGVAMKTDRISPPVDVD